MRPGLDDVRPASPRNESMMLGNLGFNSSDEDDNIKFEVRIRVCFKTHLNSPHPHTPPSHPLSHHTLTPSLTPHPHSEDLPYSRPSSGPTASSTAEQAPAA